MTTPNVLIQRGVQNESQETKMRTVRLTPNSTSNYQTRFQIPKKGHVLDSNSALVWTVSWDNYTGNSKELVLLKNFSGGLNTIRRARFYVGGKELFPNEDVGHFVHIKNLSRNPDYREEILDMELGSVNGYYTTTNGKFELGRDTEGSDGVDITGVNGIRTWYNRYARALGKYSNIPSENKGIECTLLLSDMFSALKSIELPLDLENIRLEIDWETDFDEVAYIAQDNNVSIDASRKNIKIENPVLLLDYLTYDEETYSTLKSVMQSGITVPYIHTSISQKVILGSDTDSEKTSDILIALQGKLLMKIYVSHRTADYATDGKLKAPYIGNGRCRSQIGKNFSYNLYINDLAIHDQPVNTASQQYSFFSMSSQAFNSVVPGCIEYNSIQDATALESSDINSGAYYVSGIQLPPSKEEGGDILGPIIRNMVSGTQSYIGVDLSKYPKGSGARDGVVIPADSGYRCGSSSVILRISQNGSTTPNSPEAQPKTVQIFSEEVKILQIRGMMAEVMDA